MWWRSFPVGVLLVLAACGPEDKTAESADPEGKSADAATELATVAGVTITAQDLERYEGALPDYLHSKKKGVDAHRVHLQSLVDKELGLHEARKRGLDQLPGLVQALSAMVNKRIAGELSDDMIVAGVSVTEEELRAFYEENEMGWEIWPAHILSASEADAREIIRLLEAGGSFSKLASERSLAADAEKGGNLGGFFDQSGAVNALRDGVFHLQEGQVSEPIQTIDGYEVVKVLKKKRTPFEQMRAKIVEQVGQRKGGERYKVIIDSLKEVYGLRYNRDRIHAVLDGVHRRGLDKARAAAPLIEYKGGTIRVGDAVQVLVNVEKGALPPDSVMAFRALEIVIVSDTLLALEARAQGRHQRDNIEQWKEHKRQGLMLSQLRVDAMATRVKATDAEVRAYYEQYIDTYKSLPGIIEMTEVLCDTRAEAESILARAQAGERLEELAVRHSVRPGMEPVGGHAFGDSGRVTLESLYQSPYRTFFGDSNSKDVGVLQGPLEVQDKFSIFRLDQPFAKALMAFAKVQQQIRTDIRQRREGVLFDAFLDSLRQAYSGQIQINEAALSHYAEHKLKSK